MKRYLLVPTILLCLTAGAASAQQPETGVIKDRASFMPTRKWAKLPGKIVGILLPGGKEVGALDGWGGPADLMVVSTGGNSYRKTYVPTTDNPQVTNFSVPVGDEGKSQLYPALNLANPRSVVPWGVTAPYSLVEVTVNSELGSPAVDCFVATNFKVLDGTKDYPLNVTETVETLKKRYAEWLKGKGIEKEMATLAETALKGKKATGPRETSELMFVAWLPESSTMQVRFKTKITDGAYTITKGPIGPKLPFDPKVPPRPGADGNSVPFLRIIAPRDVQIKTGTAFGIELGAAFTVNKKGEVIRIEELPIEPFTQQISNQIVSPGPRPGPVPLPPQKVDPKPDL